MTVRRLVVLLALLYPASSFAMSCAIHIEAVNHRSNNVTVQLKSFDADRALPAPSPEDFGKPIYDGAMPLILSSLEQADIPAGEAVDMRFRRICGGDFWLNWRTISSSGEIMGRGQLRAHDGQSIDIR